MRFKTIVIVSIVAMAGVLLAKANQDNKGKTIKPFAVLSGTDSEIMKDGCFRFTKQDEWNEQWRRHRAGDAPIQLGQFMSVNFDDCMAIAIFKGENGFHGNVGIENVTEFDESIRIRFVTGSVQTGSGAMRVEKVQPIRYEAGSYAFLVLPKSKKPIIFEIGNRSLLSEPYKWSESDRLPALKE